MEKRKIDGSKSLDEQKLAINFAEHAGPYRLVNFVKDNKPTNIATFEDVPLGESIPDLIIIEVQQGENISQIVSTQLAVGKNLVFDSKIYISGNESRVVCFR